MVELVRWKQGPHRPLLLRGARQTGKTWLLKEFAARCFGRLVYIDLLESERARLIFDDDFDMDRIVGDLELESGQRIDGDTLIVLDEIQESPRALTSLKYFAQNRPDLHVAAAGSYLGIARHAGTSFPVGQVDTLELHPLDFLEFLRACGQEMVAERLAERGPAAIGAALIGKLADLLAHYLVVGGMPAAVIAYLEEGSFGAARQRQRQILSDFDLDFSKHAPARILERMRLVWRSLPSQLARQHKKFVYGMVREGGRGRDFEESIQWLVDYGAVLKVPRARALRSPLAAYEDLAAFKLFCVDVGLLGAMAGLSPAIVSDGSRIYTEFKGAIAEQYACQSLVAAGLRPFYWSNERSSNELDFAIDWGTEILPIEVKAATNLKSKSLSVVHGDFDIPVCVRASLAPYERQDWLVNVPLWALGQLRLALES